MALGFRKGSAGFPPDAEYADYQSLLFCQIIPKLLSVTEPVWRYTPAEFHKLEGIHQGGSMTTRRLLVTS